MASALSRWSFVALVTGALLIGPAGAPSAGAASPRAGSVHGTEAPAAAVTAPAQPGGWTTASLSEPRANMLTTTIGDTALFVGGTSLGPPSNVVDLYDHVTRQWKTATLSVGRTAPSMATVGTKILVAGGTDGSGQDSLVLDAYDVQTGQWSAASLSRPWAGGAIVTVGRKALFVGTETVDLFDAQTGLLSTATLSQPRSGTTVAVVGTRALLAGGIANTAESAVVDMYDSASDTWSVASLSQARRSMLVAVVGTHALFAGGLGDGGPSDVVDIYDAATGTWTATKLSLARSGMTVAVAGSVVLFAGGNVRSGEQSSQPTDVVDLYDVATGGWSTARLSQARSVVAAGAGSRAVFGTTSACVFRAECPHVLDIYDSQTGAWSTTELHLPRVFSPGLVDGQPIGGIVVSVGSQVLFVGGADSATGGGGGMYYGFIPGSAVGIYDTSTGQWSEASLSGRVYSPAASATDTLVAFAGRNESPISLNPVPSTASPTVSETVDLYDGRTAEWIRGTLSAPRRDLGVAVLGDTAIFAGGTIRNGKDDATTQVDVYDGATGQWSTTTLPDQPSSATSLAVRSVGTRALFFDRYVTDTVDIYDVVTRQWRVGTLSEGRTKLAVAVVGDQVLFAGGEARSGVGHATATVDLYDSRTDSWSTFTLSEAREDPVVAVIGSRAIFAGGWADGSPARASTAIDIYDAVTGTWSTASLPTVRGGLVAATVGSRALFVDGSHADLYDVATDAWTTTTPLDIGAKPFRVQVFTVGATVLFVPRESRIVLFDSATGQWRSADPSTPRGDVAIAVVGTEVIFAGGRDSAQTSAVDIYDGRTGTWRAATLSEPRAEPAVAVVGSTAIFAGGYHDPGGSDQVDVYDSTTGEWTTARLSLPRAGITATALDKTALFAGGRVYRRGASLLSDRVDMFEFPAREGR